MSRPQRWRPTVSGEQEISLTFTVSYEATGNCYHLPARTYGEPGDCYEAESEVEIDHMSVVITDSDGDVVPEDSDIGKLVMAALNTDDIEQDMMETTPADYRGEKD